MNIGLIGSGGREHALCKKLFDSKFTENIICFPGNPGTSMMATNVEVDVLDFKKILKYIRFYKIDLVVVGPEEPLVKGIVNFLKKNGVKVFGPNKFASKLEGSKSFMKTICAQNKIPTAKFKICNTKSQVTSFVNKCKLPIVVKADGLAAGKGVTICKTKHQIIKATSEIFYGKFKSSKKAVLEEFLEGEEASYFVIVDNNSFKFFGSAQDHKQVYEKDRGPNTGGMGAYSPSRLINKNLENKILDKIINPTLNALSDIGCSYKGFLYAGLMIVNQEPYLIEYNVRMGDPECQTILPKLKTDFAEIIFACVNKKLDSINLDWSEEKSLCVVLCSKGYPDKYEKKVKINNLNVLKLDNNNYLFHAGTVIEDNEILAVGGRVLNFISLSENLSSARENIHNNLNKLNWVEGFYRKDIAFKVIGK